MSDEHSFSLHRASPEYRELASKLRELARACIFPRTAEKPIAARSVVRSQGRPFRLSGGARRCSVIGETPEWMWWVLVVLLVFVMLLPALKR
jgi:hypothetical protein